MEIHTVPGSAQTFSFHIAWLVIPAALLAILLLWLWIARRRK